MISTIEPFILILQTIPSGSEALQFLNDAGINALIGKMPSCNDATPQMIMLWRAIDGGQIRMDKVEHFFIKLDFQKPADAAANVLGLFNQFRVTHMMQADSCTVEFRRLPDHLLLTKNESIQHPAPTKETRFTPRIHHAPVNFNRIAPEQYEGTARIPARQLPQAGGIKW